MFRPCFFAFLSKVIIRFAVRLINWSMELEVLFFAKLCDIVKVVHSQDRILRSFHWNHRAPTHAASLLVCLKDKEMYGRILKSLHIVNLYRGMSKLKLKINVNLLQLLCIVVSVALHYTGEFERFGGFCVHSKTSNSQRKTHQTAQIHH